MNAEEMRTLRASGMDAVERLYDAAMEEGQTANIAELRKRLTAENYSILGKIALRLSKMPWEKCSNVHQLNEQLFIAENINMLMEDLGELS